MSDRQLPIPECPQTGTPPALDHWWFVTGPTASGKSAVAVELARNMDGEIISLDSMAVYRRLDIGTAKPGLHERAGIPHHLLDVVDPDVDYSLADYVANAWEAATHLDRRKKAVVFAGGTPLYLKSLLRGVFWGPAPDWDTRAQLLEEHRRNGPGWLHAQLAACDPSAAARLHPHDARRLIRAIEFHAQTGRRISSVQQQFDRARPAEHCRVFVLDWPRSALHERICGRVDEMFAAGLIDEVRGLRQAGVEFSRTARQALGYREVLEMLDGGIDEPNTIELVKQRTRQFARRQLTWYRSLSECRWVTVIDPFDPQVVAATIQQLGERVPIQG